MTARLSPQLSAEEIAADMFSNAAQTLDAGYTTVRDTGGINGGLVRANGACFRSVPSRSITRERYRQARHLRLGTFLGGPVAADPR